MPTSVITNTVTDPNNIPLPNIEAVIELIPGPAYRLNNGSEIASRVIYKTDVNGVWNATLEETANISPASSYYRVTERVPRTKGGQRKWYFSVPSSDTLLFNTLINPNTSSSFVVPTTVTSSTRPPSPFVGQMIFETDTGKVLFYYGTTIGWAPDWGLPWGEVAVDFDGGAPTTTSATYVDVTGVSATWTALLGRRYNTLVAVQVTLTGGTAGAGPAIAICNAANTVLDERQQNYNNATAFVSQVAFSHRGDGLDVGTTVRKLRIAVYTGTGTVGVNGATGHQTNLQVFDAGPAANPVIT